MNIIPLLLSSGNYKVSVGEHFYPEKIHGTLDFHLAFHHRNSARRRNPPIIEAITHGLFHPMASLP